MTLRHLMRKKILLGFLSIFFYFSFSTIAAPDLAVQRHLKRDQNIQEVNRIAALFQEYYKKKEAVKNEARNLALSPKGKTDKKSKQLPVISKTPPKVPLNPQENKINNDFLEEIKNDFSQWFSGNKIDCLGFFCAINNIGYSGLYQYIHIQFDPLPKQNNISKTLSIKVFTEQKPMKESNGYVDAVLINPDTIQITYPNIATQKQKITQQQYVKSLSKGDADKFQLKKNDLGWLFDFFSLIPNNEMKKKGKSSIRECLDSDFRNVNYIDTFIKNDVKYKFFSININGEYEGLIAINIRDHSKHVIIFKKKDARHILIIPYINKSILK
jgi:hypothetical protein